MCKQQWARVASTAQHLHQAAPPVPACFGVAATPFLLSSGLNSPHRWRRRCRRRHQAESLQTPEKARDRGEQPDEHTHNGEGLRKGNKKPVAADGNRRRHPPAQNPLTGTWDTFRGKERTQMFRRAEHDHPRKTPSPSTSAHGATSSPLHAIQTPPGPSEDTFRGNDRLHKRRRGGAGTYITRQQHYLRCPAPLSPVTINPSTGPQTQHQHRDTQLKKKSHLVLQPWRVVRAGRPVRVGAPHGVHAAVLRVGDPHHPVRLGGHREPALVHALGAEIDADRVTASRRRRRGGLVHHLHEEIGLLRAGQRSKRGEG